MRFPAPSGSRSVVSEETLVSRTRSMTRRLLSGCGSSTLLAYDNDPGIELGCLVHGLGPRGELLVASCLPDGHAGRAIGDHSPTNVRFDVVKEAPNAQLRILASSLHLLGQLEWLGPDLAQAMLAAGWVPEHVAAIATAPGGRLGIVHADTVLLHDAGGVTSSERGDAVEDGVAGIFPGRTEDIDAHDVVAALGSDQLALLVRALVAGHLTGVIWTERPSRSCAHAAGLTYCVDVDRTGLTLMEVGEEITRTVLVAFEREVDCVQALDRELQRLLHDSAPERQPRI